MVILGIDPGSLLTGYGVIDSDGRNNHYLACGCIRLQRVNLARQLRSIHDAMVEIVQQLQPQVVAVEKVFVYRNADSALKLGQARGAAICAVATFDLPIFEYTPNEIKKSVVGHGHAAKEQVQHMVKVLLGLSQSPSPDAADALAAALCHAHHATAPALAKPL